MMKAEVHSVVEAGEAIYQRLRHELEPTHKGKYIVIDVDTGEYEIDADHLATSDRAAAKRAGARLYGAKIGFDAICRIGRSSSVGR